ncbi:MAG TPA: glycoside hydrolase family 130 protein [Terriglobales bacterium]|nr:glycoside hydrolase family 130 protein [Terriglobales bacterium]
MQVNRRKRLLTAARSSAAIIFVAASLSLIAGAVSGRIPPFGLWERASQRPTLSPQGISFESAGVFNPAAIKRGDHFVMLYRAQDKNGTSRLGYASSRDGLHFTRRAEPVLEPATEYEKDGGVEDPRLVRIGKLFYLTYTGYNKHDAQLCMATSTDLIHWDRKGVILPAYKGNWNTGWTKSGAIVTQKVGGKYWMYYLGTTPDKNDQMGLASSPDLLHWTDETKTPVLPRRPGMFDSRVVEPGPPPVMTKDGIFLIYNGADDKLVYRTGWVLFNRNDPAMVLARSEAPIFQPGTDWEKVGQVPNVVFVEGMVRRGKTWLFYYGGADQYVGIATAPAL